MRAKKCDRCGKLYEHYDGVKEFKNGEKANAFLLIDRDLDNKYWSRKSYGLCPECMKKLEDFIGEDCLGRGDTVEEAISNCEPAEIIDKDLK